jgi:hypothetical protein
VNISEPRKSLSEEGSLFAFNNPTLGTAIAGHVAPSLANNDPTPTKTLLHIYNAGNKWITLDSLTIRYAVVNASSTATGFLVYLDQLGSTGKTSGGTAITPASCRSDAPFTSGASITFGAVVTAAASTVQRVFAYSVRPVIAVVADQYTFNFGGAVGLASSVPVNGTNVSSLHVQVPGVTILPGGNFYLAEANPSGAATAATYEFSGAYVEK